MEKKPTQPAPHHPPKQAYPQVADTGAGGQHAYSPHHQPPMKKISKALCLSHMYRYVEVQAVDGYCYDGIVEHVDDEWICLAVPGSVEPLRAFFPTFGGPFGGGFGGPFFPFRPRRFNRLVLPLAGLAAISLLPFF
jgi:hypothetical protein